MSAGCRSPEDLLPPSRPAAAMAWRSPPHPDTVAAVEEGPACRLRAPASISGALHGSPVDGLRLHEHPHLLEREREMPPGHCSLRQRRHVAGPEIQRRPILDLDPCATFEYEEDLRLRQHPRWRLRTSVRREAAQPGPHGAGIDEHMLLGTAADLG